MFSVLKKFISLLFISLYLFSYTNLREVTKLGLLIEHYQEHVSKSSIGFFDFLKMHYSFENEQDDDFEKDMALPFKSIDTSLHSSFSNYILPDREIMSFTQNTFFIDKLEEIQYENPFFPLTLSNTLLQPPDVM